MLQFCALFALWSTAAQTFNLDGHTSHVAVTRDAIYVSTEQSLYQLHLDLSVVRRVSLRGLRFNTEPTFVRVSDEAAWNSTFTVNVLLPFVSNNTMVLCGVLDDDCGYCEVLSLQDVSTVLHAESILLGPVKNRSASVTFLITEAMGPKENTYILSTREQSSKTKKSPCSLEEARLLLFNTDDKQSGSIFSFTVEPPTTFGCRANSLAVGFIDGFQVDSFIYLFSNVQTSSGNSVRLLWLNAKHKSGQVKSNTLKSLRGVTLSTGDPPDSRGKLLASSVITGTKPLWWSGVFSVDGSPENTELLLFDVSPDLSVSVDSDPHFTVQNSTFTEPKLVRPLRTLLKQSHMSSVLALTHRTHWLFFIGTTDGQIIKLVVDKNYQSTCPKVLYRANDDREVFPKLHVDEVDHKHIYVAFASQIMRIPVSKCSTYTTLHDCWSAQDPQCVWCNPTQRCTFESDCQHSSWVSISEDFQQEKMISFKSEINTSGQITVIVELHMSVGPNSPDNFACQFSQDCKPSPPPSYPQCTCVLSNILPARGLNLIVKLRMWESILSEKRNLRNCSKITGPPSAALCRVCIAAGCGWSGSSCSWAKRGSSNKIVCQVMESHMNYMKPEISSVSPKVVSFYGRNHALLKGHNLNHVTGVRIYVDPACSPSESPVWNNTGESLTFHIPSTENKGVVQMCLVLPDDSCHGNAKITYRSLPSCKDVKPGSAWLSGGRIITLVGSHMDLVDGVVQSHSPLETRSVLFSKPQNITYTSLPAENTLTSTVFLKVANQTLNCSKPITYLPDPLFTSYTFRSSGYFSITIQKKADKLDIMLEELSVWAVFEGKEYHCIMETKEADFYTCVIKNPPNADFEHLKIQVWNTTVILKPESKSTSNLMMIFLVLMLGLVLMLCIVLVMLIAYKRKHNKLPVQVNDLMENQEMDIRNDIRQEGCGAAVLTQDQGPLQISEALVDTKQ
ncbi:hypothetical protein WMY93_021284 [Mugilogobius chulae]|uniref:Sema domain-containing protein n=1 Tax=Mugilogobius chulae TaxID=88201 RepID=A0AAW0NLG0_9GOBI